MNAETVEHWLAAIGVPAQVVSVGAEADDAWCLLQSEPLDGDEPGWEVFWREQGNRYDWARFTNEQVACFYLFGRLAWTQTASGALRVETPDAPAAQDPPAAHGAPDAPVPSEPAVSSADAQPAAATGSPATQERAPVA